MSPVTFAPRVGCETSPMRRFIAFQLMRSHSNCLRRFDYMTTVQMNWTKFIFFLSPRAILPIEQVFSSTRAISLSRIKKKKKRERKQFSIGKYFNLVRDKVSTRSDCFIFLFFVLRSCSMRSAVIIYSCSVVAVAIVFCFGRHQTFLFALHYDVLSFVFLFSFLLAWAFIDAKSNIK